MEMQEIAVEGERNEENVGASEPLEKPKTEALEEAELYQYSKLQRPSEDVYSEAFYEGGLGKPKPGKRAEGNLRLYRVACIFLTLISLVLLLIVIMLSVKLQNGSTVCPGSEASKGADPAPDRRSCTYQDCQAVLPVVQTQHRSCQQCADGWLEFGPSCFFMSTFRLSWEESLRNCSTRGASLAIISSQELQTFLTKEGKMHYWIGLRQNSNRWTWVNNTVVQQSYWAGPGQRGDCGILNGGAPPEKNWIKAPCSMYTYFICELKM